MTGQFLFIHESVRSFLLIKYNFPIYQNFCYHHSSIHQDGNLQVPWERANRNLRKKSMLKKQIFQISGDINFFMDFFIKKLVKNSKIVNQKFKKKPGEYKNIPVGKFPQSILDIRGVQDFHTPKSQSPLHFNVCLFPMIPFQYMESCTPIPLKLFCTVVHFIRQGLYKLSFAH